MKALYLIFTLVASFVLSAETVRDTIRVKGKGVGESKTVALKDAYRDAVERAVGMFVDSEQLIRNDKLLQDQVLTASNAYIEKYDCVSTNTKGGLTFVEILATVRRGDLTRRLSELMPIQRVNLSKDNQNVHAQIVTELKMTDDAAALLKNELKELNPLTKLMKVTLASTKPTVERIDGEPDMVRLWYPVSVSVDTERYFKVFAPRMNKILNQIKIAGSERFDLRNIPELSSAYEQAITEKYGKSRSGVRGIMTRCDERVSDGDNSPLLITGVALNEEYKGIRFLSGTVWNEKLILTGIDDWWTRQTFGYDVCKKLFGEGDVYEDRYKRIWREFLREPTGCYTSGCRHCPLPEGGKYAVAIVLKSKGNNFTLTGNIYTVPYEYAAIISAWQDKMCMGKNDSIETEHDSSAPTVEYVVSFKDEHGEEVAGSTFDLMNVYLSNIACVSLKAPERENGVRKGGRQISFISPLVGGFSNGYVKWMNVSLPKDDVLKITSVDIKAE